MENMKSKQKPKIYSPLWMKILKKIYDNHNTILNYDFENEFTITQLNKAIKGNYSNTYIMVQLFVEQGLMYCNIQPYKKLYRLSSKGEHLGEHVSEVLYLMNRFKLERGEKE